MLKNGGMFYTAQSGIWQIVWLETVPAKHITQLDQLQELHQKDTQWLKEDIRLWRRIALISIGIGLVLLTLLLVYFTWTHLA